MHLSTHLSQFYVQDKVRPWNGREGALGQERLRSGRTIHRGRRTRRSGAFQFCTVLSAGTACVSFAQCLFTCLAARHYTSLGFVV